MDAGVPVRRTGVHAPAVLAIAWIAVAVASALPTVLFMELGRTAPPWLRPAQLALLAVGLVAALRIRALRALRLVVAVFLVVLAGEWVVGTIFADADALVADQPPFVGAMLAVQLQRLALALLVVAASLALFRDRKAFFLASGDPGALAAPIRWIGVTRPTPWRRLAPLGALCLAGGVVVFIVLGGGAPLSNVAAALPVLPFVLLFAATNALSEELVYRAPQLAALAGAVGSTHALLMTAAYFGVAHFYGVPYGVVGVVMSALLGWFLGRSMVETHGLSCAWLVHFAMDVVIFAFIAAGSIAPGGA